MGNCSAFINITIFTLSFLPCGDLSPAVINFANILNPCKTKCLDDLDRNCLTLPKTFFATSLKTKNHAKLTNLQLV